MRRPRPNPVSTTSAPAFWARSATVYAIESWVRTPVMSSLRPSSMLPGSLCCDAADAPDDPRRDVGTRERAVLHLEHPGLWKQLARGVDGLDRRPRVVAVQEDREAIARGAGDRDGTVAEPRPQAFEHDLVRDVADDLGDAFADPRIVELRVGRGHDAAQEAAVVALGLFAEELEDRPRAGKRVGPAPHDPVDRAAARTHDRGHELGALGEHVQRDGRAGACAHEGGGRALGGDDLGQVGGVGGQIVGAVGVRAAGAARVVGEDAMVGCQLVAQPGEDGWGRPQAVRDHDEWSLAGGLDVEGDAVAGAHRGHKPTLGLVWGCLAPAPAGHGRLRRGGRIGLRVCQRQAGAPFDVGQQGRAELGVGGEPRVVGGQRDQRDPAEALRLGDGQPLVLAEHVRIPPVALGVVGRAAEDLGQPGRDAPRMVGGHAREHRRQQLVAADPLVEGLGEAAEGGLAACPFVEGWDVGAHVSSVGTTVSSMRRPPRTTATRTSRPISSATISRWRSSTPETGAPSTATIRSSERRPARSAGLLRTTSTTSTASVAPPAAARARGGRGRGPPATPSHERRTRPSVINDPTMRRVAVLIGTARPRPTPATAVLTPTTSPRPVTSAPPELPGLRAASVWMTLSMMRVAARLRAGSERPSADTTPAVTEPAKPLGLPIATTSWPTRSASASPSVAGIRSRASARSTARSDNGSAPTISNENSRPSVKDALPRWRAPATTWADVSRKPSGVRAMPLPAPAGTCPPRTRRVMRRLATLGATASTTPTTVRE